MQQLFLNQIRIFIFFLLFSFNGFSQIEIIGKCIDRTEKALPDVFIYEIGGTDTVVSKFDGKYKFISKKTGKTQLVFDYFGKKKAKTIILSKNKIKLKDIQFNVQVFDDITKEKRAEDPFEIDELPLMDFQLLPRGSVENFITLATSASSNNELTSNYNVRGGSYDENLVYVNGFNIYRPFLTRSGQQEGMSFIHSSLVENIKFSAGGFDSEYGDKLSSVLDIKYREPDSLSGSLTASILGVEGHLEQRVGARFDYIIGGRFRSNGYFLNSLPTKGAYNPVFWDAQFVTNFQLTENLTWSLLGHFSSNNYRFTPQTSRTDFGTANEAYSFRVYFEGKEQTVFRTLTGGTSLKWKASKKTNLDLYATVFNTDEKEYFDILGQYFLNELETDPSKEEFGDSIASIGVGSFLDHARNQLQGTIFNVYHNGSHLLFKGFKSEDKKKFQKHQMKWGINFQHDQFKDRLSEWHLIDSAGYSVPQNNPNVVELNEVIKGKLSLTSQRYTGFLQFNSIFKNNAFNKVVTVKKKVGKGKEKIKKEFTDTLSISSSRWAISFGSRVGYTTANREFFATPRLSVVYSPRAYLVKRGKIEKRQVNIRFGTGLYYQPPFYREFRTFTGQLNTNVRAQKSYHAILGTDVYFNMWNREVPFKFSAEIFYKHLWDVNPYEIDNVRTRYYAENNAVAYAYGLDLNIRGQFIEGVESFFKLGFLQTKENLFGDSYKEYYNQAGEKIIFGYSEDQTIVDSVTIYPGYIPRPTDQWLTFGALIQDRMPKAEQLSVQVGVQFGAPLPYGPPDFNRFRDTLRLKSYFRVDMGMSYDFLYKAKRQGKANFFTKTFSSIILSAEVFNLLGIRNQLSKQWIQDVSGKHYAIPNELTSRRFNLKLLLRF